MKKLIIFFGTLLSLGVLSGCDKEIPVVAVAENVTSGQTFLKINYVSAYASNPNVQLKLNNTRVSNVITARTPFPGGGFNTGGGSSNDYLALNPGNIPLSITVPNRNALSDSIVLFNSGLTLDAGKYYSAHITDTGASTKMIVLQDDLTKPDTGRSRYRFVNLMPNVPSIDLYYGTTKVASSVAYLTSSPYFDLPTPNPRQDWIIREAGVTTSSLATYGVANNANTTLTQRVYTVFASGYKSGTGARLPFVAFYLIN